MLRNKVRLRIGSVIGTCVRDLAAFYGAFFSGFFWQYFKRQFQSEWSGFFFTSFMNQLRLHRYVYHRWERGAMRGIFFFWGGGEVLKTVEGKRGDGKNFWRQEGGRPMFLDTIERLNICVFIDKPLPTLIVGSKFTVFALFILYLRAIFQVQAPWGAI